jgi:mycoredoxin
MTGLYTLTPSQIVMYVTEYCADCMRVKQFFEVNNIPYIRVGFEGNREAAEFFMQVNNGYQSVPTIIFPDGSVLVEPSWDEFKQKFN